MINIVIITEIELGVDTGVRTWAMVLVDNNAQTIPALFWQVADKQGKVSQT